MFERRIDERIRLRKERFDETKRKKKKINNELFKAYFTLLSKPKQYVQKIKRERKHRNK